MINVVGRPPLDAAGVRLCTFEHVLCNTSSMPCDWLPCHTEGLREAAMVNGNVPITLENLGQIRRDPCCSAENFVLDSCDDAARELESAFGGASEIWNETEMTDSSTDASVAVVCDLTTVDEGRDVSGLARVAARLGDVAVCFGASLPAADVARGSEDEIRVALERQLVVGVDVAADVSRTFASGAPAAPRAAFVGPLRPALDEGTDPILYDGHPDIPYIRAAAAAASRQGAPVVVVLPGYKGAQLRECARAVIELADAPAWVFRVARLDDQHGPGDLDDLLDLAPNVLVVADGWYRPCDRGTRPPSKYLLSGYIAARDRVVVAGGVRYRTQLRRYGGAGYGAGLIAVRDAEVRDINFAAAAPRLAWYRPPKKRPADIVELQCSRCGRSFEVRRGHHYGKYVFVYCGRGCLDAHRDAGFDASEVTGPTASAQGV
jgi:hypothetical protein